MEKSPEQAILDNNSNVTANGAKLRQYRESYGISAQEAADRLRLNVKFINYFENQAVITPTMPLTYIRGYLRAYCKLLNIARADAELLIAEFNLIDQAPVVKIPEPMPARVNFLVTIAKVLAKICCAPQLLIALLLLGVLGSWWLLGLHQHNSAQSSSKMMQQAPPPPQQQQDKVIVPDTPAKAMLNVPASFGSANPPTNDLNILHNMKPQEPGFAGMALKKPAPVVRPAQWHSANETIDDVEYQE